MVSGSCTTGVISGSLLFAIAGNEDTDSGGHRLYILKPMTGPAASNLNKNRGKEPKFLKLSTNKYSGTIF